MKRRLVIYPALFFVTLYSVGQNKSAQKNASSQTAVSHHSVEPINVTSSTGFVLEDATPMRLRFNRNVSSADAHVGDTVDFEVLQDVSVNGVLVISKGGLAFGTVTEAQPKRRMARGGKLEINLDYVKLQDSEKVALRAVQGGSGGGHTGAMTAGIVATGLVFFPAAPFFLFMHGKDLTMPKGAELTAYVNGDTRLDMAKFEAPDKTKQSSPTAEIASVATAGSTRLHIDSSPIGADIEIDGNFVGNTPSEVQVAEGDHTVTVRKAGFKDWERKLKVNIGSNVHLSAELEKTQAQ